ncbi:MAG: hypothetical protein Q8J64_03590 [Thermodesulfovibrionales bacterium]|nr:hypothetical protein [Thermodesulfovibrionales bacterium]
MERRIAFLAVIIPALLLTLSGCGSNMYEGLDDKDTKEARQLEVVKHLDSGDYQWLLDRPSEVSATDYSAAAMGLAGLKPTELIKSLNNMSTGIKNDLSPVAALSINPDALGYLVEAKKKLIAERASKPDDPELNFQLTMTSLVSSLTALAQVGIANVAGFNPRDGISQSEAATLGNFVAANPNAGVNADVDGDGSITGADTLVVLVANDVTAINAALPKSQLGSGSDMSQVLTSVTGSLDAPNGVSDGPGVTAGDISSYLKNIFGK